MLIPTYNKLFNPVIEAIKNLGGSAKNDEILSEISKILKLTDEEASELYNGGNRSVLDYRVAWAKSYLKVYGILSNSTRGVWSLTTKGLKTDKVNINEVKKFVKSCEHSSNAEEPTNIPLQEKDSACNFIEETTEEIKWEDKLIATLKKMNPFAFERLVQRLLRETGFDNVEVTKKSGDGGIDGKGVFKIAGFVSFNIYFQCKRYEGTVPSSVIRDFRGAIMGRADKGLIITTGVFSKDAKDEARRDGALIIDLIDGHDLANKLKEFNLGVKIIEQVEINEKWFNEL